MAISHSIPDHVKKQAMDAVSHHETTEFMRLHGFVSEGVPTSPPVAKRPAGVIGEAVKRQAMDAVSHPDTKAHVRMVADTGTVFPPTTPTREATQAAERVNALHRGGAAIDAVQRQVTQDGFARHHE